MTGTNEVFCTNCRARIAADAVYCTECGAEQSQAVADDGSDAGGTHLPADEEYCASCGDVIEAGVPYCPECGASQDRETTVEEEPADRHWVVGFRPGATLRNVGVGLLYFFFYWIGIPLLIYGYLHRKRGWSNRKIGVGVVAVFVAVTALLFVVGLTVEAPESSSDASASAGTQVTATPGAAAQTEQSLDVGVRIQYSGEWNGAVSVLYDGESTTESISGTGTATIRIEDDPDTVSVNAQKDDDSAATLTVQILDDGEVVAEASTDSAYGVAQTSSQVDGFA